MPEWPASPACALRRSLACLLLLLALSPGLYGGCLLDTKDEITPGQRVVNLFSMKILVREGTTDVYLSNPKKTLELMIRGTYADQTEKMIEPITVEWSPVSGDAGQISINGQFTALKRGTSEIEARLGLVKDRIYLHVFD